MDPQPYDIRWIQHADSGLKMQRQMILSENPPEDDQDLIQNDACGGIDNENTDQGYLVHEMPTEEDIDQIAAENLIFMAHDGQMVAEIIQATTDANGTVVVSASDGTPIDYAVLDAARAVPSCTVACMPQEVMQANDAASELVQFQEDYVEAQVVTEEVITDDWVQPQGEERVVISAEQILGSSSLASLDNEVPLPTVQDEYTALRPYPCDFCSRRFRKKTSLMNHMVAHQNDRPHLCKLCGSRFFRRSDLINHLKAHAETPDPEFDDVEFIHFEEQRQHQTDDHYYEQDWNMQTTYSNTAEISPNVTAGMANASHNSCPDVARRDFDRARPKEENYTIDESLRQSEADGNTTQLGYDEIPQSSGGDKVEETFGTPAADDRNPFPVTDEGKPFVCQQCGLSFAREKALLSHTKTHRNDSPYECNHCNEMFWDNASLQDHLKSHQFEESNSDYEPAEADETQTDSEPEYLYGEFYCHDCGMAFHRQDLLKRHARQHSNKDKESHRDGHCCNTCGETFAEALDLLAHAEIHARYAPFKCVLCGESFFEESNIRRHLKSVHSDEMTENSCILCGKECRDRKALMKHAWDHSREKSHVCSKCGKNFYNVARLKRHMVSHRNKSVACDVCHEQFPDGRTLSNHRHSHSAAAAGRLFPCTACGKTFGSRSSQQIHVRIHTGERPYGCRYCWKAFADGGTLRKHERIHTGEKPYACAVCPRAFNQRVVLREHIRSHHSGPHPALGTFQCAVCSAELASSAELLRHLIHHSDLITAMQRHPITGPRKYKRRRKLKPHELASLRRSNGDTTGGLASDVDISDLDMENVGDLLRASERNAIAHAKRQRQSDSSSRTVHMASTGTFAEGQKQRCNSSGSNSDGKLGSWQSKLMNSSSNCGDDTYKSLMSNVENTLQSIEPLVVGSGGAAQGDVGDSSTQGVLQRDESSPEERIAVQALPSRVRSNKKPLSLSKMTRPRMIHTSRIVKPLKSTGGTKTVTAAARQSAPASNYGQGTTRPQRNVKQEQNIHNSNNTDRGHHSSDVYDAQLLLEATSMRKVVYEKYTPDIVNDLEEILRSPDKPNEKSRRRRFGSESSSAANYLVVDQPEQDQEEEEAAEEQHLIKIEPTSPDIDDIVGGGGDNRGSAGDSRRPVRSTRRRPIGNRKYLEFETEMSHLLYGHTKAAKSKRQQHNQKSPKTASCSKNNRNYGTADGYGKKFTTAAVAAAGGDNNTPFSSIAAVVAAAAANEVAVAQAKADNTCDERKQRFYECEMCSAVFPDRAQLLDHVPVHI